MCRSRNSVCSALRDWEGIVVYYYRTVTKYLPIYYIPKAIDDRSRRGDRSTIAAAVVYETQTDFFAIFWLQYGSRAPMYHFCSCGTPVQHILRNAMLQPLVHYIFENVIGFPSIED